MSEYKYRPESISDDFTDWVTFIEPDAIFIERTFSNNKIKKCSSNLVSVRGGNAWSSDDIKGILAKTSESNFFKEDGAVFILTKTVGGEGQKKPFLISHENVSVTIMPPGTEVKNSIPASEPIADMVYVLTKIYRQQLLSKECFSLQPDK